MTAKQQGSLHNPGTRRNWSRGYHYTVKDEIDLLLCQVPISYTYVFIDHFIKLI